MNVVEKIKNFIFIRAVAIYGENHIKKYLSQSKKSDKISEKMLLKLMKKTGIPNSEKNMILPISTP